MHLAFFDKGLVFTYAVGTQTTELTAGISFPVGLDLVHCDGVTTTGEDIPLVITVMDDLLIRPSIPTFFIAQVVE
jgi:hypothetical protein